MAEMVQTITEIGEPVLVTQNGAAPVVVHDAQPYEQQQQSLALLKMLALGRRHPGGQLPRCR